MRKTYAVNQAMLSLFAELVLDEAIRNFREQRLYKEIDRALAIKDESYFLELTRELKNLQKMKIV